ncbi:MAG: hypothetical protein K8R75_02900 [Deltaproteobacteria bacterium]|nr:hypothetical protein [Deltaproteobacteria bacterium]
MTLSYGCPTSAGGRWDTTRFQIGARLFHKGKLVSEAALSYTGNPSEFEGFFVLYKYKGILNPNP